MNLELTQKELLLLLSAIRNDRTGTWGDERSKQLEALEMKLTSEYRKKIIYS